VFWPNGRFAPPNSDIRDGLQKAPDDAGAMCFGAEENSVACTDHGSPFWATWTVRIGHFLEHGRDPPLTLARDDRPLESEAAAVHDSSGHPPHQRAAGEA
jgi:hypothetical protein